jgi:peptidoglycan/xylan/chitin deacetylase (PgdA/CDA1 family)
LKFVSPALKHIVFPALSRSGYLRHNLADGPAIVTYHGVFPAGYRARAAGLDGNLVHVNALRKQLCLLKRHYHVISPNDFLSWLEQKIAGRTVSLPPRAVLLTCDDALHNTVTEMLPILQEQDVRCLFFATGESAAHSRSMLWYEELYLILLQAPDPQTFHIPEHGIKVDSIPKEERHARWWKLVETLAKFDRELRLQLLDNIRQQLKLPNNWRDRFIQDSVQAARFLKSDRAGLHQLAAAGMSIGAHTFSHPILAQTSDEIARREIFESKTLLEEALGREIWAFAYPFGTATTVTKRDIQLAQSAGFRSAFMNAGGGFGARFDPFAMPRFHVTSDMVLGEFEAHLAGFYRTLRKKLLPSADEALF